MSDNTDWGIPVVNPNPDPIPEIPTFPPVPLGCPPTPARHKAGQTVDYVLGEHTGSAVVRERKGGTIFMPGTTEIWPEGSGCRTYPLPARDRWGCYWITILGDDGYATRGAIKAHESELSRGDGQ